MEKVKTKRVKAFTIIEGDTVLIGNNMQAVVKEVKELDRRSLSVDYTNGSLGIYQRQNLVTKVIL